MKPDKIRHRLLIVTGSDSTYEYFQGLLPPEEYECILRASNAGEANRMLLTTTIDMLIVNTPLSDEFGTEFAMHLADEAMGILLMVKNDLFEQVSYQVEDLGILTIPKPTTRPNLFAAMKLLSAFSNRINRMEQKNQSLKEKMTDIRFVNRAKWLLIEHLNMTETDAHRYIEKQAMDSRLSKREIAENIIRTYDK